MQNKERAKEKETKEHKHDYPPVWDSVLKAWINNPPPPMAGRGTKE